MKKAFILFTTLFLFIIFVDEAKAIIILPAIILIPIAKLVAIILGGLSVPVLGTSALLHKISGKPILKGILIGLSILLLVGVIVAILLKVSNSGRPLF